MPSTADRDEPDTALLEASGRGHESVSKAMPMGCDSIPLEVHEAARAAFAWRTVAAELAELTYDSVLDSPQLDSEDPLDPQEPRRLRFEVADVTIELEVHDAGGHRWLKGQILPPQAWTLKVRHERGDRDLDADARGRFQLLGVARGPVSMLCRLGLGDTARVLETEWVML
ncbi:MAG: hypothetical protein ACRDZO_10305 [Egibacteraceae bacterium]